MISLSVNAHRKTKGCPFSTLGSFHPCGDGMLPRLKENGDLREILRLFPFLNSSFGSATTRKCIHACCVPQNSEQKPRYVPGLSA
jgi:hypothetical protein